MENTIELSKIFERFSEEIGEIKPRQLKRFYKKWNDEITIKPTLKDMILILDLFKHFPSLKRKNISIGCFFYFRKFKFIYKSYLGRIQKMVTDKRLEEIIKRYEKIIGPIKSGEVIQFMNYLAEKRKAIDYDTFDALLNLWEKIPSVRAKRMNLYQLFYFVKYRKRWEETKLDDLLEKGDINELRRHISKIRSYRFICE
jgi:hypothetical protein